MRTVKSVVDYKLRLALGEKDDIDSRLQSDNELLQKELDKLSEQETENSDREFELHGGFDLLHQKLAALRSKHETETEFLRGRLEALDIGAFLSGSP
jgi:hypothetical protein